MPQRTDPTAIVGLLEALEPVLRRHGFEPLSGKSEWTGKFNVFTWVRRSWKEDAVRLGWRKPPVASYFLDAQWSVPRPDGALLMAASLDAGYGRRGLRDFDLPQHLPIVGLIAAARWRAAVVADAEFALAWCNRCGTRDGALAELARPERNGPRAGSEAYAHVEQYVRAHAPER
jgi:hypothetical protein